MAKVLAAPSLLPSARIVVIGQRVGLAEAAQAADGPYPADTIFVCAKNGMFDGIVTMYHDQGQIAMKLMGFERGVTVQGGLPIAITTPVHGTAYDIAGKGLANPQALSNALAIAARVGAAAKLSAAAPCGPSSRS